MLGVNPDSLSVIGKETIPRLARGEIPIVITDVEFELPDGKKINHTHFSGIILNDGYIRITGDSLDQSHPRGRHLRKRVQDAIGYSQHILLLRKAGERYPGTTGIFYPLLPEGAVVVADLIDKTERDLFQELDLTDVDLVDCRTEATRKELEELDKMTSYTGNNPKPPYLRFKYGYLHHGLVDLTIDRVVSTKTS